MRGRCSRSTETAVACAVLSAFALGQLTKVPRGQRTLQHSRIRRLCFGVRGHVRAFKAAIPRWRDRTPKTHALPPAPDGRSLNPAALNRAFSAGGFFEFTNPGALPQADNETAPSAQHILGHYPRFATANPSCGGL
jgi:hypothetical protein